MEGHTAHGRDENKIFVRKLGEDHLGDLCIDAKILLKWISNKHSVRMQTGFIWLRT
jgi:hypothetical protein